MKKSKLLMALISMILLILVIGNLSVLATEGPTQITANTSNDGNSVGATNTNTNTNKNTNTNTNKRTNTNTNKASNLVAGTNTAKNTSSYNSTSATSSSLPYAGTNTTTVVLIALGFAASAVYAYKKVTDYNI